MVEGGPIDFLTGDYLAELTLLILWKNQRRDPSTGYALSYLRQMEEVLGTCLDKGIKVVTNAGGLNPAGLASKLREMADRLGLPAKVAHIEGDDLLPRIPELQRKGELFQHLDTGAILAEARVEPVAANAYLGGWGIVEALNTGADVVVCPRVTDASVVVGPAAWHFGWKRDDWDQLAGAVVAGHIIECGTQCTGGNYAFFKEVPSFRHIGFPLAEVRADGSSVITKHPGTGGLVSVGTVTAQVLYEIGSERYMNPDVVARFDSIQLSQEGPDRVLVSGVRGEPAPETTKVCINYLGGYRNSFTFALTGLDIEAKARMAADALFEKVGGREAFDDVTEQLIRSDQPDPTSNELATATLRITVKDKDQKKVGRALSSAVTEIALASYPGFYGGGRPTGEDELAIYWPALVAAGVVDETVVAPDGRRLKVSHWDGDRGAPAPVIASAPFPRPPEGPTRRLPLGTIIGARSGDKGGNANVGLWAMSDGAYSWLRHYLTLERFREIVPDAGGLEVRRYELPNIRALNFVVVGLLGQGVASSTRADAQAKSFGEYLRSKLVDIPESLL
jgi:hypothetical protein